LTLSLSGAEAESAARYGNLKLEEAVDDKGTSLIPAKDTFHEAAKFKDYSNAFFRKSWSLNGGPAQKTLTLRQAVDSSMKLVAKIAVDRKITKVSFDLKNIDLP